MAEVTYDIVEHDGGWAYEIGDWNLQRRPNRGFAPIDAEQSTGDRQVRRDAEAADVEDGPR